MALSVHFIINFKDFKDMFTSLSKYHALVRD